MLFVIGGVGTPNSWDLEFIGSAAMCSIAELATTTKETGPRIIVSSTMTITEACSLGMETGIRLGMNSPERLYILEYPAGIREIPSK